MVLQGHLERLSVVDLVLVRLDYFVHVARVARDYYLRGVGIPLQVVDLLTLRQAHHTNRLIQVQVVVAIRLEEENLTIASSCHEHCLGGGELKFANWRVVSLEHYIQLNVAIINADNSDDTTIISHSC